MKEIQDNTKREIPRSWMGRINYCENDYTMQSNLQIQQNPSQITKGITGLWLSWSYKCCKAMIWRVYEE